MRLCPVTLCKNINGKKKYLLNENNNNLLNKRLFLYEKYNFSKQDITSLSFSNLHFETLLMSGVLEHIPNYELAISEACRVASKYVILHRCFRYRSSLFDVVDTQDVF